MPLPPELIGRIILAKFLSLSLKRYEKEINKAENSDIFKTFFKDFITFKMFPLARLSGGKKAFTQNTLGRIEQDGETFYIRYRLLGFAGEYSLDLEKLTKLNGSLNLPEFPKVEIDLLNRKLRLISTRNRITYMTLLGIIEHQSAYLKSCDPLKFVPLTQVQISRWINHQGYRSIDNSMISRIANGTSILMPDKKQIALKDLFPSSKEICKRYIKAILAKEDIKLKSKRLNRPYTDEEIKQTLKRAYGLGVSRRTISYCRNQIGIPAFHMRTYNIIYPPGWAHFTTHYPMTLSSVKENAPETSGIYELSVKNANIEYPLNSTGIFYIGSSNNIKKRLRAHMGCSSKNEGLNAFTKGGECFFQVYCLQ